VFGVGIIRILAGFGVCNTLSCVVFGVGIIRILGGFCGYIVGFNGCVGRAYFCVGFGVCVNLVYFGIFGFCVILVFVFCACF